VASGWTVKTTVGTDVRSCRGRQASDGLTYIPWVLDTVGMKTHLTQAERRGRTRAKLVQTARREFMRHGFNGASLDQIADAAGYSKGAVYSNFESKADLFLSVLDAHFEDRARDYAGVALDGGTADESYRAVARFRIAAAERDPGWEPLLLEFWTYAARRPHLRAALAERRERFLHLIAGLIDELAARHDLAYTIPTVEVARGSAALLRGLMIERMLDRSASPPQLMEAMHAAYMKGLTAP
jgi:AcrR family transcriptional regulator